MTKKPENTQISPLLVMTVQLFRIDKGGPKYPSNKKKKIQVMKNFCNMHLMYIIRHTLLRVYCKNLTQKNIQVESTEDVVCLSAGRSRIHNNFLSAALASTCPISPLITALPLEF